MIPAEEAKKKLIEGNQKYLDAKAGIGDVSRAIRMKTAKEGQHPYAIVITCSDSRVVPESIFSAGIGDLFVIRVAGNVLDNHQLGSIEYAAEHLGTKLIVMLGHTRCGAVGSVIAGHSGGLVDYILKDIAAAIGDEKDDFKASCLNVQHGVQRIRHEFEIHPIEDEKGLQVIGAIYHIEDGTVEFLIRWSDVLHHFLSDKVEQNAVSASAAWNCHLLLSVPAPWSYERSSQSYRNHRSERTADEVSRLGVDKIKMDNSHFSGFLHYSVHLYVAGAYQPAAIRRGSWNDHNILDG